MGVGRRLFGIGRAEGGDRRRRRRRGEEEPVDPAAGIAEAVRGQRLAVDDAARAVGELAVQRRRTELLHERAEDQVAGHERAARVAVGNGDDEAARAALGRALEAGGVRDRLADQVAALVHKEQALRADLARLEEHLRETESRRRALAADREVARASARITEAMRADVPGSAEVSIRAAEREVAELTSRREAWEEIALTDAGSHQARAEFDRLGREAEIEAELRRVRGETGQIGRGETEDAGGVRD